MPQITDHCNSHLIRVIEPLVNDLNNLCLQSFSNDFATCAANQALYESKLCFWVDMLIFSYKLRD